MINNKHGGPHGTNDRDLLHVSSTALPVFSADAINLIQKPLIVSRTGLILFEQMMKRPGLAKELIKRGLVVVKECQR